mmetsp:Transcript_24005/g.48001  ORF Transcript_24005/g.48001 Transcript_24005/m.48001 type:complete len:178 (+) Transcript_24005:265-798(+)
MARGGGATQPWLRIAGPLPHHVPPFGAGAATVGAGTAAIGAVVVGAEVAAAAVTVAVAMGVGTALLAENGPAEVKGPTRGAPGPDTAEERVGAAGAAPDAAPGALAKGMAMVWRRGVKAEAATEGLLPSVARGGRTEEGRGAEGIGAESGGRTEEGGRKGEAAWRGAREAPVGGAGR